MKNENRLINMHLKAKKHFGQHFLVNEKIANDIVDALSFSVNSNIIEIGPGKGVLTQYLIEKEAHLKVVEIDSDCVKIIQKKFNKIDLIHGDFLKIDLSKVGFEKYAIIGNFPYNISSQILFKVLESRDSIFELVGMFQKEVAERICSKPGSKKYGILSVVIQAYFDCEYLLEVPPDNFQPIPKVHSAVIKIVRNTRKKLDCNHSDFMKIVKISFSQRRKKLKNALKNFTNLNHEKLKHLMSKRAEELSVSDFVKLTNMIS
mgnify:CR=1 FL=1